ncbi:MAG TPA: NADP-dependent oxidoreductase [Gaiellaceae bacterium]
MRAFTLDSFDLPPGLHDDLPEPRAGEGELLVRVHASSVNPVDVGTAAGLLKDMLPHELPVTLGRDFAGVVEGIGGGVSGYRAGDEVFGFLPIANPTVHDGSWAELITVPEDDFVASKPRDVGMAEAGAAPLAAITALAALDALAPARDETLLVIGAAGGVGSFFVQLAAQAGAHVIAPALADDADHLRELGVGETFDRKADLNASVRERCPDGVDAILDLVNHVPQEALLKDGGRLASTLGAAGDGPQRFNLVAQPSVANLRRLAELLDDRILRVHIKQSFELADAAGALQALSDSHTQGKLGLAS